ncbi:MAG: CYTH domain-containing protein [Dysgonamonadaceae bacterium]|jgi:adenylate cyclase|nr:CYTH domain-containing protein [Dysgonamonadaceae bacterium]
MGQEIERKFLIAGDFRHCITKSLRIRQGYLSIDTDRTVRVRVKGDHGYITVKGMRNEGGFSRFEWEKEIPLPEAQELLQLCGSRIIDKTRHLIPVGIHTFEVDEFYGENEGLIMAEIELSAEDEAFERPSWLGKEVTDDARYYNAMLIQHPYTKW